jgi:mannose-1-phosphate guanylyltransferase
MIDLAEWPALVLTAGLATRLAPLSSVRAKAALPVAGEVLVRRLLRHLRQAGIARVVLNLHHRPETITAHVGDGTDLGLEVRYSWEDPVLGSAGGVRRALPLLDADRFLVANGDTLTDVDIAAIVRQHADAGVLVTMAVVPGDTARYGGVMVDGGGSISGFMPATAPAAPAAPAAAVPPAAPVPFHFIGVQAVEARAFAEVPDGQPAETIRWLYPRLIAEYPGCLRAYVSEAEFLDIGTPADYLATATRVAAREGRPPDVGDAAQIDPSARVRGSILWDRVTIGAGAELDACIVTDDVVVPAGSRHVRQALVMVEGRMVATSI